MAVDKGYGDKKSTIFPRFQAWRHHAKFICEYGDVGQEVSVQCEYDIQADKKDEKKVYHMFTVIDLVLHRGQKMDGKMDTTKEVVKKTSSNAVSSPSFIDEEEDDDLPF